MSDNWIKMRAALFSHPKVLRMSREIAKVLEARDRAPGWGTPSVTRDVTVSALMRVWCAANEHTSDGIWHGIDLDDLDSVAEIDGFGSIMGMVGWAVYDADKQTVTFPNFLEYNAPSKFWKVVRQRRFRKKHQGVQKRCTHATKSNASRTQSVPRDIDIDIDSTMLRTHRGAREPLARARGALEDLEAYAVEIGMPASDGRWCHDKWEGSGWVNKGGPIIDWKATMRSWKTQGFLPSQKSARRTSRTSDPNAIPRNSRTRSI
jgi:hypothetical protein